MPCTSSSCSPQKSAICLKLIVVLSTSQTAVALVMIGLDMMPRLLHACLFHRPAGAVPARPGRVSIVGEIAGRIRNPGRKGKTKNAVHVASDGIFAGGRRRGRADRADGFGCHVLPMNRQPG